MRRTPEGAALYQDQRIKSLERRIRGARSAIALAQAAGIVNGIGTISNGAGITTAVTFPVGRFTQPPVVVATPGNSRLQASIVSVTTTGCTVRMENWSNLTDATAPNYFHWIAVQMTADSGSG